MGGHPTQPLPLPCGQPTPDPVGLAVVDRDPQTIQPHPTAVTHPLRPDRHLAPVGVPGVGVAAQTRRVSFPAGCRVRVVGQVGGSLSDPETLFGGEQPSQMVDAHLPVGGGTAAADMRAHHGATSGPVRPRSISARTAFATDWHADSCALRDRTASSPAWRIASAR